VCAELFQVLDRRFSRRYRQDYKVNRVRGWVGSHQWLLRPAPAIRPAERLKGNADTVIERESNPRTMLFQRQGRNSASGKARGMAAAYRKCKEPLAASVASTVPTAN